VEEGDSVHPVKKPTWQQATALVSLSTCGAMTGLSFTHGTVADVTSPTSMPAHLLDFTQPARTAPAAAPARASAPASASAADGTLRSAIINVARYYLRMAQTKTPAEMEAIIWRSDSVDGVDHGESCAAFASLTLELGAKAVGQESWVTGGTSYPWPLQSWADVRVDPNPASPDVISVLQDAESQHRWHPVGDGYRPQPGDWVMFDDHVEVVTKYSGGVLSTIGGDSLPNFSVNAHQYSGSLAGQGVAGFVNNGELLSAQSQAAGQSPASQSPAGQSPAGQSSASQSAQAIGGVMTLPGSQATSTLSHANHGQAAIPGTLLAALSGGNSQQAPNASSRPRQPAATVRTTGTSSTPSIPGVQAIEDDLPVLSPAASNSSAASGTSSASPASPTSSTPGYRRNNPPAATTGVPDTASQQAFISQIAPGAMAAQARYGIPAAVTIAQAIEESGWGQSVLAVRDHNLFGIKGTGPAGADMQPTREYQNGSWLTQTAAFKVYHNVAESIADHSQLLATGPSYQQAMADRHVPDAFAADLTGVYATDPTYGTNLIALMKLYNLYRYGAGTSGTPATPQTASPVSSPSTTPSPSSTAGPNGAPSPSDTPRPSSTPSPSDTPRPSSTPSPTGTPSSSGTAGPTGTPSQGGTLSQGGTVSQGRSRSRNGGTQDQGGATIPGILDAYTPATTAPAGTRASAPEVTAGEPRPARRPAPRIAPRGARTGTRRYVLQIPRAVTTDFLTTAKAPLTRAEPLYQDVATRSGIRWELLAACDWMQCKAQPRNSPVHGEKLGTTNADGTVYRTKSEALAQCANDLVELAMAVYWIDITARRTLSVRNLANVFAAFRWGGLLKLHNVSAMEFPYSVEGLTAQHLKMRWPDMKERNAPDKPGSRFRQQFGAVPVVLSLNYPAVDELSAART
jgi:flagellum-specific peptidoglycan hydrolase FlgJ